MRRTVCGLSDLAEAAAKGDDCLAAAAAILGYEPLPVQPPAMEATAEVVAPTITRSSTPTVEKSAAPTMHFWLAWRYEQLEEIEPDEELPPEDDKPIGHWTDRPAERAKRRPLAPWSRLGPRLRTAAAQRRNTRRVDVQRVVDHVSRGRTLTRLPRQPRQTWGRSVHVLVDRSRRLTPFWEDQDEVLRRLRRHIPRESLSVAIVDDLAPHLELDEQQDLFPEEGSLVVALGDLGMLEGSHQVQRFWQELGGRLRRSDCRLLAITPCAPSRWTAALARCWRLLAWDRGRAALAGSLASTEGDDSLNLLLCALAPAARIEPGLLRDVRVHLRVTDPGAEADFWQHPCLSSRFPEAATMEAQAASRQLQRFSTLPLEQRRQVVETMRRWRAHLAGEVWLMELALMDAASRGFVSENDRGDAERLLRQLAEAVEKTDAASNERAFAHRLQSRQRPGTLEDRELSRLYHRLWWALHGDDPDAHPPAGFDPRLIPVGKDQETVHTYQWTQRGSQFNVTRAEDPGAAHTSAGSPIATLRSRNGLIVVSPAEIPPKDPAFWKSGKPPAWANDWGRDQYGPWVEFTVTGLAGEKVTQRMRWIPPGTFLMGSPEDEVGRDENEGPQHEVTLTEGFWMFDTAVTQQLWSKVVGPDPSEFHAGSRPVEMVAWQDTQQFCKKLEVLLNTTVTLPSEAQWEYACRAGTSTRYHFGDEITPRCAHYGASGQRSTVPVGLYPANAWGLFDMHGNVWERCRDAKRTYSTGPIADPLGRTDGLAGHEIRGGSWYDDARYVRASYRDANHSEHRSYNVGFRCVCAAAGVEPAEEDDPRAELRVVPSTDRAAVGVRVDGSKAARVAVPDRSIIIVSSDVDQLELRQVAKPDWASAFGRDRYGLWADLTVEFERGIRVPAQGMFWPFGAQRPPSGRKADNITQRLRWIPPGRFLMGSPETEEGRYDNEGPQHWVTISQGFWMFDAPCTQELWTAVMVANPSRFKDPRRPVESVDWQSASDFAKRLTKHARGLTIDLPTEVQWEYACRAGTQSAIYTGALEILGDANAPSLDPIAWYGGNSGVEYELEEGYEGHWLDNKQFEFEKSGTRRVKEKLPNPWGLYDMLGNVWEWCKDERRTYTANPLNDPVGPTEEAAYRAFRGGSWRNGARDVRAACRLANLPGYRYGSLGFRCVCVPAPSGVSAAREVVISDATFPVDWQATVESE